MDKLAHEGIKLERQYTFHWCSPSRASLMTGRLPAHVMQSGTEAVPREFTFLPALLKQAGYATAHVGKWHLGNFHPWQTPEGRGFDTSHAYLGAALDYHTMEAKADGWPCKGKDWFVNGKPDTGAPHGKSSLELQRQAIVSVIKEHKAKFGSKRMFLYVATQAMHTPLPKPGFNLQYYTKFSTEFAYVSLSTVATVCVRECIYMLKLYMPSSQPSSLT